MISSLPFLLPSNNCANLFTTPSLIALTAEPDSGRCHLSNSVFPVFSGFLAILSEGPKCSLMFLPPDICDLSY
ncbi:Bikaverin cluster transcription factor bik5 [Fusarium oxysporum f. sp. albedinis]|nr:Bikaverin cluster transcription factor bik5 [Fusarium oxysporum f. sp. albedinis]